MPLIQPVAIDIIPTTDFFHELVGWVIEGNLKKKRRKKKYNSSSTTRFNSLARHCQKPGVGNGEEHAMIHSLQAPATTDNNMYMYGSLLNGSDGVRTMEGVSLALLLQGLSGELLHDIVGSCQLTKLHVLQSFH